MKIILISKHYENILDQAELSNSERLLSDDVLLLNSFSKILIAKGNNK